MISSDTPTQKKAPSPHPTKPGSIPAKTIAIVGAGAAGFFTAITLLEKNPQVAIILYEAAPKPLQKVRISGGGRCNLTHACFEPQELAAHYPRGEKALLGMFSRFQPKDTIQWFESHGLPLKTEPDGRIFPQANTSDAVIDLFLNLASIYKSRFVLKRKTRVLAIAQQASGTFLITSETETQPAKNPQTHSHNATATKVKTTESVDCCVLATGYSPPGWQLAEALGHSIKPVAPSLFPFKINQSLLTGLQGISIAPCKGTLTVSSQASTSQSNKNPQSDKKLSSQNKASHKKKPFKTAAEGILLVTHHGVSGPLIYRLSAWGAQALKNSQYQASLHLDFLPDCLPSELDNDLQAFWHENRLKQAGNTRFKAFPQRFWQALLTEASIDLTQRVDRISKKQHQTLAALLKQLPLTVTGKSPSKEEFVSCGGVPLNEIDCKTMESNRVKNLYLAGEILDIDGLTGGFNFQACWTAAWIISDALSVSDPCYD
ncbi:MAG: NAD(P)/FAD-dependent oxidoreductase [Cyanobacteria bacterium P01_H01_bin.74]